MTEVISLAGIPFRIEHRYRLPSGLEDYRTDEEPLYTVSATDEDLDAERKLSLRNNGSLEFVCIYRKIAEVLPLHDAFVMHGAAISRGEGCYLITAPSGTGKTTHARLWLKAFPDAWILNGDKPILRKQDGRFYAYGTPWNGKERYGTNGRSEVKAISLLHRSEINEIFPAGGGDMIGFIMKQVYLPREPICRIRQLELMDEFLQSTPIYRMGCNMDPEAAIIAYEAMSQPGRTP